MRHMIVEHVHIDSIMKVLFEWYFVRHMLVAYGVRIGQQLGSPMEQ